MKTASKSILFIVLGLAGIGAIAFSTATTRRLVARAVEDVPALGMRAWSLDQLDPANPSDQDRLRRGLADPEAPIRKACAEAIARGEGAGAPLVPALLERAQDPEPEVARAVAEALAAIGLDALPALLEALDSDGLPRRRGAALALANLGPEAAAARPGLARALRDPDPDLRAVAVIALARIGSPAEAIPQLMPSRKDPHPSVRGAAEKAIGALVLSDGYLDSLDRIPPDQAWFAYPSVFQSLSSDDSARIIKAAATLKKMGAAGKDAAPKLIELVRSKDPEVRQAALGALASVFVVPKLARDRQPLIQAFSRGLKSKDPELRALCVRALGQMPPEVVAKTLSPRLADKDELVRSEAIAAVARRGSAAVPGLVRSLSQRDPETAAAAGLTLALIGRPAVAPLLKLLGGRNKLLSERASSALTAMKGPAIPALLDALRGPDSPKKQASMVALIGMGSSATPELMRVYEERGIETCASVLIIWEAMGEASAEARPLLAREITIPRSPLRAGALRALSALGPRSTDLSADITPLLKSADAELRQAAAEALGASAAPSPATSAALEAVSADEKEDRFVREAASAAAARLRARGEERKG